MSSDSESISSEDEQNLTSTSDEDEDDDVEEQEEEDDEEDKEDKSDKDKSDIDSDSDIITDDDDEDEELGEESEDGLDDGSSSIANEITDTETIIADKNCLYKYVSNEKEKQIVIEYITGDDRITKPYITKYERVKLLGIRTQQIASGAKPMLKNTKDLSPIEIAKLELENKVIPLIIHRPLSNNKIEVWKISDFI